MCIYGRLMKGADAKAAEVMEQAFAGFETENIARWQLGGNLDCDVQKAP